MHGTGGCLLLFGIVGLHCIALHCMAQVGVVQCVVFLVCIALHCMAQVGGCEGCMPLGTVYMVVPIAHAAVFQPVLTRQSGLHGAALLPA